MSTTLSKKLHMAALVSLLIGTVPFWLHYRIQASLALQNGDQPRFIEALLQFFFAIPSVVTWSFFPWLYWLWSAVIVYRSAQIASQSRSIAFRLALPILFAGVAISLWAEWMCAYFVSPMGHPYMLVEATAGLVSREMANTCLQVIFLLPFVVAVPAVMMFCGQVAKAAGYQRGLWIALATALGFALPVLLSLLLPSLKIGNSQMASWFLPQAVGYFIAFNSLGRLSDHLKDGAAQTPTQSEGAHA